METIWSDPQYRTEGERTDAALKRYAGGVVPLRQTREDLGYSQTQIRRMEQADALELPPRFTPPVEEDTEDGQAPGFGGTPPA